MMMRYYHLKYYPEVFLAVTGLRVHEFDQLVKDLRPLYKEAEQARLDRPDRERAIGAGHPFALRFMDELLLTIVWLRIYPTHEVLGYLFGVSDSTAGRIIRRVLPVLEQAGRDTMRMPDPGRKRRRDLSQLLEELPDVVVVVDSFEQRIQRPSDREEQEEYYSGKKRQHTAKSQVVVDEVTGQGVDVSEGVPGRKADITLFKESKVQEELPEGVGMIGDLGYKGIEKVLPAGLGATPRKKPRGQPRPPEDREYNRAFSSRRIIAEMFIGRMRWYQSITQTDRNHRRLLDERRTAIAGLANYQIAMRLPAGWVTSNVAA